MTVRKHSPDNHIAREHGRLSLPTSNHGSRIDNSDMVIPAFNPYYI
jgi:hypothetical protein